MMECPIYNKVYATLVSLFFFSVFCPAQTTFRGEIKDSEGKPAEDATVVVSSLADSLHTLAYTFSDVKGLYNLSFNSVDKEVRISIYGFNIKRIKKIVANCTSTLNFSVTSEIINLKEVTVKAGKLWQIGDTLNYSVGAFFSKNDVSIGDVLKKMPGLSVASSGEVSYQGKPISHFYIDGLDVLQGRYGIATRNLTPAAVSVVQVLENHQPIKALKKIEIPEQAAINLRLKDSAKGIISLEAMLGLGADTQGMLWQNELVATYFTKKKQYFATYKNTNNGTDIGSELQTLARDNAARAAQYTSVRRPLPPAIDKPQYYFNNSNALSFSTVWKTRNDNKVNLGLIYFNDYEKRDSYSETTYIIPSSSNTIISERMHDGSNTDKLEGSFSYEVNKEKLFLSDKLHIKGLWNSDNGIADTGRSIHQQLQMNEFRITNNLNWILKKNDYRGVNMISKQTYEERPQTLDVYPCLYDTFFVSKRQMPEGIYQKVRSSTLAWENSASLLTAIMLGKVRISPRAICNFRYDVLDSHLLPLPMPTNYADSRLQNDTYFYRLQCGMSADISYEPSPSIQLNCELPYTFNIDRLKQNAQQVSMTRRDGDFELYSRIYWKIGNYLSLESHYSMGREHPLIGTQYGGYIMSGYRMLSAYTANLWRSKWQFADMQFNYKNAISMLFASLSASYNRNDPRILYGYHINGILSNVITKETDRYSENTSLKAYLSKGFYWKGFTFSLTGEWNKGHSPVLRQEKTLKYISESYSLSGNTKIDLLKILTLTYDGTWYLGKGKQEGGEEFPVVRTLNNHVDLSLQLPASLFLNASLNNYYNNQALTDKSFTLSNLSLAYHSKSIRYSFSCQNLFNVKNYTYSYINDLTRFYSEYHIRSRAIMFTMRFKIK